MSSHSFLQISPKSFLLSFVVDPSAYIRPAVFCVVVHAVIMLNMNQMGSGSCNAVGFERKRS